MTFFTEKNISVTLLTLGIVAAVSAFGNRAKSALSSESSENDLIRKYLLNDSPLYGYNRPKLWIHTKYEYNARKWKSFGSRSTTDLNQPYIHLTVKSIIQQCGDDFNICLIDDDSFSQLLPNWNADIRTMAEPFKDHYREQAFAELLYIYGGMFVPNSFVCLTNLMPLFKMGTQGSRPFVCEMINKYSNVISDQRWRNFTSSTYFMGAIKRDPQMRAFADYMQNRNESRHFSAEADFFGYTSKWLNHEVVSGNFNLIDGVYIGIKTTTGKPISLENLVEDNALEICPNRTYGVYIPAGEFLERTNYQWFAVMESKNLLKTNMIITKYIIQSLVAQPKLKVPDMESRTVVSI
jgi:hypothetical protein